MKLLDKVKKRLEENYGVDFLSEFWNDDQIVLLEDIVDATEKEVNNINHTRCCKSDSGLLCECKNTEPEIDGWVRCKDCGDVFMV